MTYYFIYQTLLTLFDNSPNLLQPQSEGQPALSVPCAGVFPSGQHPNQESSQLLGLTLAEIIINNIKIVITSFKQMHMKNYLSYNNEQIEMSGDNNFQ